MTPIKAPSALLPPWAFAVAVLALIAVGWWGVVRPLNRARAAGLSVSYRQRFSSGKRWWPIAVGLVLLLGVLALIPVATGAPGSLDTGVHSFFVDHRTGWLGVVAIVVTNLGSPFGSAALMIVAAGLLARRTASWTPPLIVVIGPLLTGATNTAIKYLVHRTRPPTVDQLVITTDPSFPSGHVAWVVSTWGCLAIAVLWVFPHVHRALLIGLFSIMPVLIVLSRLYLGVHWFTDVCAAALLGGGATALTLGLFRTVSDRRLRQREPAEPGTTVVDGPPNLEIDGLERTPQD